MCIVLKMPAISLNEGRCPGKAAQQRFISAANPCGVYSGTSGRNPLHACTRFIAPRMHPLSALRRRSGRLRRGLSGRLCFASCTLRACVAFLLGLAELAESLALSCLRTRLIRSSIILAKHTPCFCRKRTGNVSCATTMPRQCCKNKSTTRPTVGSAPGRMQAVCLTSTNTAATLRCRN